MENKNYTECIVCFQAYEIIGTRIDILHMTMRSVD